MNDIKAKALAEARPPEEKTDIDGESDLRYVDHAVGSLFVGIVAYRGPNVFAVIEDQKKKWRLPGGKAEQQDDPKGILRAIAEEKGCAGVNYQDLIALTRMAAKREAFEETGNTIDTKRLEFAYAVSGKDEKVEGSLHIKVFFKYKLKENENWVVDPKQPSTEEEKVIDSRWVKIIYLTDPNNPEKPGKIRLDPFIPMSPSHFKAILQFARSR